MNPKVRSFSFRWSRSSTRPGPSGLASQVCPLKQQAGVQDGPTTLEGLFDAPNEFAKIVCSSPQRLAIMQDNLERRGAKLRSTLFQSVDHTEHVYVYLLHANV